MLDAQVAGGADATVGLLVAQFSPPFRNLAPSFLPSFHDLYVAADGPVLVKVAQGAGSVAVLLRSALAG